MEKNNNKILNITKILVVIVIAILLYFLYEYLAAYYYEYQELKAAKVHYQQIIKDKNEELSKYNNKIEDYEKQIDFMDNHVAICPLDGSNLYHKYNCERLDTSISGMIYNIEQAIYEGYSPCENCKNTSSIKSSWDEYKEKKEKENR